MSWLADIASDLYLILKFSFNINVRILVSEPSTCKRCLKGVLRGGWRPRQWHHQNWQTSQFPSNAASHCKGSQIIVSHWTATLWMFHLPKTWNANFLEKTDSKFYWNGFRQHGMPRGGSLPPCSDLRTLRSLLSCPSIKLHIFDPSGSTLKQPRPAMCSAQHAHPLT